ncbi:MAG: hypothetical protein EOP87_00080 [Verrucomicrobiaceae bacterium]|nr:MAG: hypothetical protein EOP87_00080 [Verrucomicrobiaceae bacterium]
MITTGKPDRLEMTIPPEYTARLADRASKSGLSTADMAFTILAERLDALDAAEQLSRRPVKILNTGRRAGMEVGA